jgi:hypothetical protein
MSALGWLALGAWMLFVVGIVALVRGASGGPRKPRRARW